VSTQLQGDSAHLSPQPVTIPCELYPIALHEKVVKEAKPGDKLANIPSGTRPGNFG
jgi:hypothetical protein